MDMKKIGAFLAQLRKEKNLTQEQLGEKLGVTNKTVSRWETGTYLPPVEMLQNLSRLYDITINEILSGQRLNAAQYLEKAEENIKTALNSGFTLQERIDFFKRKWLKDHLFENILCALVVFGFLIAVLALDNLLYFLGSAISHLVLTLIQRNRMMAYVEEHAFDGTGR